MKSIAVREAVKAVSGIYHGPEELQDRLIRGIAIDNRKTEKDWLFVPIKGDRFDGHSFIDGAFEAGALVTLSEKRTDHPYIEVKDTAAAFRDIAEYYKSLFDIKTVGITGSVGKTTTKEMIASVLSQSFNTIYTQGNLNNQTGVPLTVLGIEETHEAAVIEMGTNHFGEIAAVAKVARPDVCVLTNIGEAHLEFLGSKEGILKAKTEMLDYMKEGGKVVINGDDPYLRTLKEKRSDTVSFGFNEDNDIYVSDIDERGLEGIAFTAVTASGELKAFVHVPGRHMVLNAMAAAAVGLIYGMDLDSIAKGIDAYEPLSGRFSIKKGNGLTVIDDVYNASPTAMKSSIDALSLAQGRKVCILGDMLELGDSSRVKHLSVGRYASDKDIDLIIAVGRQAEAIAEGSSENGSETAYFEDQESLIEKIGYLIKEGDTVLVKASRGMHLEKTVERLLSED
ncbi:MAG: UDP-N-acetylmuramoyl-tripeptide--D-alanyl-D-alanine ligase [Christensenellaceae bacterium]|nr:UDP-N-acetylmuramoyl-tripeptide--D-alanyl-D-alanine ligase [Christensenellaceae bacterium]